MAWLDGWSYRKPLTIDHTKISSDLTALRVPIILNSGNFDFSKAESDLSDIRVCDSDGNTPFDYEVSGIIQDIINSGLDDSSASGHSFTAAGGANVNTSDFKYGAGSLALDGSGDYIHAADSPDWDLGSFDFCIEAWVKFADTGNNTICARATSGSSYFYFTFEGTNLRFRDYTGVNNVDIQRTVSITTGVWYHVAATRSGNDWRLFLDGVQQGATVTSSATMTDRAVQLDIGHLTVAGGYEFNGRIDDFRWTVGDARYTSNFTPPTAQLTSDANTKCLLNFEVVYGDVTDAIIWAKVTNVSSSVDEDIYLYYGNSSASDESDAAAVWDDYTAVWHLESLPSADSTGNGHTASGAGTSPTQTTGIIGYALKGGGSGSYAKAPDHNDLDLTGDFELSWKMYWVSSVSNGSIFGKSQGGGGSPKWIINYGNLVGGAMAFHAAGSTVSWAWSPSADTWYHCRLKRTGNSWSFYVNGSQVGSTSVSAITVPNTTQNFCFFTDGESWKWFSGRLDEARLLNGSIFDAALDGASYYADSNQLLTFGDEEENTVVPTQLAPSLEWLAELETEANFKAPELQWLASQGHKFIPNLVHYPIYFPTPSVTTSKVPVAWSGCFPGFTITMKDTGSSGTTTVEIYVNGVLKSTVNIAADNLGYSKLQYVLMDTLLSPLDELDVHVTAVATGAEDLKVDLYEMTFPFELEVSGLGNKQGTIEYNGLNREHLFLSADYWYIELNQPIIAADYVKIIDTHGQEVPVTPILERGYFYNSRIRFAPYEDGVVDHIRIRVQDSFEVYHVFNVKPVTTPYMADFPENTARRLVSAVASDTDSTGSGTATATEITSNSPAKAVDDISNLTSYYATSPSIGLPQSWAYDFGSGSEKTITKLSVKPFTNQNGVYMKDFEIWGSNLASPDLTDDGDWDAIYANHVEAVSEFQDFEFENETAYRWYRIKISSNYRSFQDAGIDELEMFETIYTYSSEIELDCWVGAKYYRYSFDNGSTWTDWLTVSDTQKLSLDFENKTTGTYNMKVQYQMGENTIEDSFDILYATGDLDASIQYLGEQARILYEDDIPFNRVEVYYDDILEKLESPTIFTGFETVTTNNSNQTIEVAAGSIYYQNKKYDWDGSAYTVVPDLSNFDVMFRVLFGFNTKDGTFEFKESVNETPGAPITETIEDFIILWMVEYSLSTQAVDFSSYDVYFSSSASSIPEASVTIEVAEDRKIEVRVYDVAGRYTSSKWSPTKTKYNIWRSMTVTANPYTSSDTADDDYQNAVDDDAGTYWTSPLAGPLPHWLRYDFGISNKKTIVEYTLSTRTEDASAKPTDWKLQGSNDGGVTWDDLDVVTGYTWANNGPFTFSIDEPASYASYRILFEDSSGGDYVQVREWELMDEEDGDDLIDPDASIEILPGEIHGFSSLDFDIESEDWENPL